MTALEEIFAELRDKGPKQAGRAYRGVPGPEDLSLRIFVDGTTRLPGLSLTVPKKSVPVDLQFPRMRGARFSIEPVAPAEGRAASGVSYEFSAADDAYAPVFIELACQSIRDVASESNAQSGLRAFARRVEAWALFFNARGTAGLSREAQLGLIGELICLRRLLGLIGAEAALRAWTGPTRTVHDFQTARGAVEVKLSTASSPERIRITSERQLDGFPVSWLALFTVLAQESASGDHSVELLVDRCRAELAETSPLIVPLFDERLTQCGYADVDRSLYEVRLAVRSETFLRVDEDFPRIVPADIPAGVFNVSYDLTWSTIAQFRITDDDVRRQLGRSE